MNAKNCSYKLFHFLIHLSSFMHILPIYKICKVCVIYRDCSGFFHGEYVICYYDIKINNYIFRFSMEGRCRRCRRVLHYLDQQYNKDLVTGREYVYTYMRQLKQWCECWSRVHDLLIDNIDTTCPLEWPSTPGNLQPGSWSDTPCDYFRDIPYLSSTGTSIHDID